MVKTTTTITKNSHTQMLVIFLQGTDFCFHKTSGITVQKLYGKEEYF